MIILLTVYCFHENIHIIFLLRQCAYQKPENKKIKFNKSRRKYRFYIINLTFKRHGHRGNCLTTLNSFYRTCEIQKFQEALSELRQAGPQQLKKPAHYRACSKQNSGAVRAFSLQPVRSMREFTSNSSLHDPPATAMAGSRRASLR